MKAHSRLMAVASAALAVAGLTATPASAATTRADAVPIATEQQICSNLFGATATS
jgi:hypothetical protein